MLRSLQQAVIDVQQISRPQLQVQLQNNGLRVLSVQQPGASQLSVAATVRTEKIGRGKRAIKVPQTFATSSVRATQFVTSIVAVPGSVAAQARGQASGGLGLGARQRARGAEARLRLSGSRQAAAFIRGIPTFILTVALPGTRKTLPIPTEEFI